jgi:CheY-like chemotaxis protein/CHASE3 domain sensor protein
MPNTADTATAAGVPARSRAWLPLGTAAAFAMALVAIVLIALATFDATVSTQQASARTKATMETLERLQTLMSGLKDAETGQRGYLLTGAEPYLEPYYGGRAAHAGREQQLRELLAGNARQTERLDVLAQLVPQRMAELEESIERRRAGDAEGAIEMVRSNRGKATMDRIRQLVAAMIADEQAALQQRQAGWEDSSARAARIVLGGALLLLALTLAAAIVAARDHRAREDELWIRAGTTALARQLQGEQRLDQLAERLLALLSRLLDAPLAALYGREADGSLQLLAAQGAARDTLPPRLLPGDGLPAQAAAEGRSLHLRDLPPEHLQGTPQLGSALGRSRPCELMVVPAIHEGQLQAVLELGFLRPVDAAQRELLARAADALAAAVEGARDRSRLEQLLEETRRQAEELQSQEEELRVSNEELEQQSRVLRESQTQLETQQSELERVNGQLALHAGTLERQQHELLASQAELQDQARVLAAASRYKSEFLANMSHELRTPLNSSLILSRLLIDNKPGTLDVEQIRYARAIHDANNDLLALINDILDLSKIEAGRAELHAESVDLAALLQRLRTSFEMTARDKGLQFDAGIEPGTPAAISSDGQRLAQVLKNLLSNAIKFTAQGRVALRLRPSAAFAGGGVRFEVHDTGLGIASEKQQIIFEAFRQADGSTSRQFGGTGLGLSISRELVQRMGGQIAVDSAPGRGSRFSVELPARMPEQAEEAAPAAPAVPIAAAPMSPPPLPPLPSPPAAPLPPPLPRPADSRRVLLAVEDDSRFADVLQGLVHEAGFDCVVAGSGAQALALARELQPAGVLLDVGLPDVSGLSVLERLKADPATRHIPVHLVSAAERSPVALQMGAIGHVVKPAPREQLVEAIERLRDRADQRPRRLLIVEDDARLRDSLHELLDGPGVEIVTVGTVAAALQALAGSSFDCMVTDLALPDGSGFDLLERMAADPASAFPPVIVYTGRALGRDEETRLRRYSQSIIVKGARSPERLLDEVTLFLHSVESQLPGEQQRLLRAARQRDAVLDGRRILLAEDDVRNIFALSAVFEPLGVTLEIARNGREAVQRLQQPGAPEVDLVLMDVMMPEMDGLAAMRAIRASPAPRLRELPIIALTAKAMSDDRQQCLDAGANDYLAKPIDIDRLVSLCRVWMPK